MEYGHYNFTAELQKLPSTANGVFLNDALHLHGGSWVKWILPPRCKTFKSQLVCADTGIAANVRPVTINGQEFRLNEAIEIPLEGFLHVSTQDGPGTHLAFKSPRIEVDKTTQPDLSEQLKCSS